MKRMCSERKDICFEYVEENGVKLKVNKDSLDPRRNEAYYCREMDINRSLIATALSVFITSGDSVFSPPRCIDGIAACGVSGLVWKKYFGANVDVVINDLNDTCHTVICDNARTNDLQITALKKDPCVVLHELPFSFISLDCHTDASLYFDSVFRNAPKRGIFALTTKDDCALYGRTPERALRNYGGVITRTFYSKELAVRLILAGMVRSAARYSKGLHILCVLSVKSFITIIVKILKGSSHADLCVDKVRRLVHCSMCEDRLFYSSSIYPHDSPSKLLSCDCQANTPGKVTLELGPVWCGSLFDANFIYNMSLHLKNFPWRTQLNEVLRNLLTEAWCPNIKDEKILARILPPKNSSSLVKSCKQDKDGEESNVPPSKKLKEEFLPSQGCLKTVPAPEPSFFYNLHRHSPKNPNMAKLEDVIISLRKAGFRASRTHFDPVAVRTDACLNDLQKVITGESK